MSRSWCRRAGQARGVGIGAWSAEGRARGGAVVVLRDRESRSHGEGRQCVKPWVLWRVFYLEPVVAGWGSSIVWLVLWLSAWSVSSGGGV